MSARRFFVDGPREAGERVAIGERDAHKIARVLRLRDGDELEIVDAAGVDAAWADSRDHLKAALKSLLRTEDKDRRRLVAQLAAGHDEILKRMARYLARGLGSLRTRIHGDLHLRHVLVCGGDVAIINFEGDSTKPLEARRACTLRRLD